MITCSWCNERELRELVKKGKRPGALFIDEAHDLNGHSLIGLMRLKEVVEDVGGRLSVILAGHRKLRNYLRRQTMEEIGYRTDIRFRYLRTICQRQRGETSSEDSVPHETFRQRIHQKFWVST